MKTKFYLLTLAMSLMISASAQQMNLPVKQQQQGNISAGWYAEASSYINNMYQDFYEVNAGLFNLLKADAGIKFSISPKGYKVVKMTGENNTGNWDANFMLQEISKGGKAIGSHDFVIVKGRNQLVYKGKGFDVEYINEAAGLRQNFIIRENTGGAGPLTVKMKLESALQARLSGNDKLVFHERNKPGNIKLIYEDLKVWDAAKKELDAKMVFNEKTAVLEIVVNDQAAVYPVTIDPLNRAPEWITSANGILPGLLTNLQLQVQTLYGYTVTSLGDINGDTYDDVAVSAPTMADVISGTGSLTSVGAVFIYLGSPAGLPVAPSKVLQPNTAVTGALFGLSVDAGDVTGDGKNDIVIGAPLDRYQTTAEGLLGATTVNVRAGKVYVYRSEDLFSAPNPTPFLQIRLQGENFFCTGVAGLLGSNIAVNALFGYSVAVTDDMNGDDKADILIGSPAYLGIDLLSVKSGAAFLYLSDTLTTKTPIQFETPTPSLLDLPLLPLANTSGLLFGYSVDGIGDYNGDGHPDIVIGAPAGIDVSSLSGIFSGQVLGGSAYVYYGNGDGANKGIGVRLQANSSGLLSNAANLFGFKVKGVRNAFGQRNGNILVGSPAGNVVSNVLNGLRVKAGAVHVFTKKSSSPSGPVVSVQAISSPRSSSVLSILSGQTINVSLLYGASMDNMLDVNCDGIADIIIGEPLSTAVPLLGADVVGGAAYVYTGKADGTYNTTPLWDLHADVSADLGINATALVGYSVAGARYVKGRAQGVRALVGGPSNALDFGSGVLNLGNTLGTTLDFTFDNNGLGKSYTFQFSSCNITLPSDLVEFTGTKQNKTVQLNWLTVSEENVNLYELQRSTDASRFETIAMVFAKNASRNEYGYLDAHPYTGINYYRLKTVDNNGQFKYSNVIAVKFDEKVTGDIVVAPNPVIGNDIRIKLTGLETGMYKMELHTASGQLVQTKMTRVSQHDQVEVISKKEGMASGLYWLNVYDNNYNKVKSVRVFIGSN